MTDQQERPVPHSEQDEPEPLYDPEAHPHPVRAKDVLPLIQKIIG